LVTLILNLSSKFIIMLGKSCISMLQVPPVFIPSDVRKKLQTIHIDWSLALKLSTIKFHDSFLMNVHFSLNDGVHFFNGASILTLPVLFPFPSPFPFLPFTVAP